MEKAYDLKNVDSVEIFNALEFKFKQAFLGVIGEAGEPGYILLLHNDCSKKSVEIGGEIFTEIQMPIKICSFEDGVSSIIFLKINPFSIAVDDYGEVENLSYALRNFIRKKFPDSSYVEDFAEFGKSSNNECAY